MGSIKRLNCWDYMGCSCHPDSGGSDVCPVIDAKEFDGLNGGLNGGRYCWHVEDALCRMGSLELNRKEPLNCASCDFFYYVREQEGPSIQI